MGSILPAEPCATPGALLALILPLPPLLQQSRLLPSVRYLLPFLFFFSPLQFKSTCIDYDI